MPYAAGLATALLLSGCGGSVPPAGPATVPLVAQSDSPTVATEGTATTSATTTPEDPVPARIPKAARPNTQAGAEAFAKFFMEQVAQMWIEADPSVIDGLFGTSCASCLNFVEGAKEYRKKGIHHERAAFDVTDSLMNRLTDEGSWVAVRLTQHAVPVVDERGTKVDDTEPGRGELILELHFAEHWQVIKISRG